MHTRAPCTRPPAHASPSLAIGRFRPGLLVVRQCGHAGPPTAQAQVGRSPSHEVSFCMRIYYCTPRVLICAVSANSHALALRVHATTLRSISLSQAPDAAGDLRATHAASAPSPGHQVSLDSQLHPFAAHPCICALPRAPGLRCSDDRDRFFALAGDRCSCRSHGCGQC